MTRNRRSAKTAGTAMETLVVGYLARWVDRRIERRTRNGAKDRGDVSGLHHMGQDVAVEVKDYGGQLHPATWMTEARIEAGNADAPIALVIAKRRGTRRPEDQWVLTTLGDLVTLLTGDTAHKEDQ